MKLLLTSSGISNTSIYNALVESRARLTMLFWYAAYCFGLSFVSRGLVEGVKENKICGFLGDISYPIYITHYAFIYIYTGWVSDNEHVPLELKLIYGALTFAVSII